MGNISDLSDFEHGMIVGARRVGSSISETAGLLGFSRMTVSTVNPEWCDKQTNIQSATVLWVKTGKDGKDSASFQAGHKQVNNDAVQQWCAERHLGTHNSLVLVTDGLLPNPGSCCVILKAESGFCISSTS
jgi:hypothetical protein